MPWPESDLPNFVGAFNPGLGQPYPRPDDIMGFTDSLDIGVETSLVRPMDLEFVTVMRDKGLYDPAINRWISPKLRRNNGMEVMILVGRASGNCLQPCLPRLSFCVRIGVILGLCGCAIIRYWFFVRFS